METNTSKCDTAKRSTRKEDIWFLLIKWSRGV